MQRPAHLTDEEWADYLACEADHQDLMAQVVDRDNQIENGLISSYDEYEFDFRGGGFDGAGEPAAVEEAQRAVYDEEPPF